MSDSVQPHRRQPTRLLRPWDSPGKDTGVGCHFLLQCMKVKSESEVAQSCPTLSDPTDCSLPGSSVHGIFQARVLEWGVIAWSPSPLLTKPFIATSILQSSTGHGRTTSLFIPGPGSSLALTTAASPMDNELILTPEISYSTPLIPLRDSAGTKCQQADKEADICKNKLMKKGIMSHKLNRQFSRD